MKKLSNFYRNSQVNEEELKKRLRKLKLVKLADGRYDVIGDVNFSGLGLTSLLEIPIRIRKVTGDFNCSYNQLVTLEGAPRYVDGGFICDHNQLETLKGAPERVGGGFNCSYNNLRDLKGAPKYVGGSFCCWSNYLQILEGAPERVDGNFYCSGNLEKFTEEEVRKLVDVRGEVVV